ncbi:hypothetical protein JIN85_07230 [Luteolibacter pohnpeiensis]|uniref:Uncharacterized protein n=1 Tax=Luteolibacter pohnpeiensis TaxID=454153 RepID=A0A934VVH9_9BACT|nr:hypothetical protein [Luteolibacter pohnpeiensis]MBK1882200.1 hypothetical protein [Luteolibacter pohnpeiensis]
MRSTALILAFISFGILPGQLRAQENEPPKHTLRILPLGDPPPFKQQIRDNVRYELPAEPGTVPPRSVSINWTPPGEQKLPEPLPLRLRLGTISAPQTFTLPKDRIVTVKTEDGALWSRLSLSQSNATLALVWRGGKTWETARAMSIPDSPEGDLHQSVRFVNLTAAPMGITFGKEKVRLDTGKSLIKTLATADPTTVMIQYQGKDGTLQTCLSTQIDRSSRTFQQYFIYAADTQSSRTPVKVLSIAEPR